MPVGIPCAEAAALPTAAAQPDLARAKARAKPELADGDRMMAEVGA
jgi:hypothetical protein